MILAILFSIIGLGVITATLRRMTINALPVFAGMTAGFAAHHAGLGMLEAVMNAFAIGALAFGLFDALTLPNIHPAIRLSARAIYAAPACAAAWFMTLAFTKMGHVSEVSATLLAIIAVAYVGQKAWQQLSETD
ncbi:MAG: hypothetical protein RLZZ366_2099 [Pseudomonadota bacterium]|jgi:hypothetical protein